MVSRSSVRPLVDGRLATLSCSAALHHTRVALGAEGWQVDVVRLPDPGTDHILNHELKMVPQLDVDPSKTLS